MLTLTEAAVNKVKEIYAGDQTLQGKSLRIFVEKGGCSNLQYGFAFDQKQDGDVALPMEGLDVVVDSASSDYLKGCTIDYKDSFGSSGFAISNPNAKKTCGCGQSFEA